MKEILSVFEETRNKKAREVLLLKDFKQNKNDYLHRGKYDIFSYSLIDSESGRKEYCKNYIALNMI